MGVYIKGMKMPENCSECVISRLGKCGVSGKEIVLWQTNRKGDRPPNCPLIEVPPHGRLGDFDAFESIKYELPNGQKTFNRGFHSGVQYVQRLIINAPTVIPAKEDKE